MRHGNSPVSAAGVLRTETPKSTGFAWYAAQRPATRPAG
jgi:hypothetical protein